MKNDSLESRIALMSAAYNRLRRVANILTEKAEELEVIAGDVDLLKDYVVSRQWLDDFESDERGEIGPGVDRSVLSEDACTILWPTSTTLCTLSKGYRSVSPPIRSWISCRKNERKE